jgi:pyruvate formate lyase activating enzyme
VRQEYGEGLIDRWVSRLPNQYNTDHTGLIFNIQKFSVHDGPGIRTTVFMKGCPLRCRWCSNPESLTPHSEIMVANARCILCRRCAETCPERAIRLNKVIKIDRLRCDLCLKCADVCPTGAIKTVGQLMALQEVLSEIMKDELFYQNSGGGVTISGGEPLMQWKFVRNLLKECQREGVHTALDTSGYAPWDVFQEVLKYVDLCLYDIKHTIPESHRRGTGKSNRRIIENFYLTASSVRTWLRVPVIPGYNDSEENIMNFMDLAKKGNVEKVSLLPYHEYGKAKYDQLGRNYRLGHLKPPNNDSLQRLQKHFQDAQVNVTIGF